MTAQIPPDSPVEFGLQLCSQFFPEEDAVVRFEEQVEQVRFARDAGFGAVWASQHYLADPFQYLHPLAVLARLVPESGDMRIGTSITLMALGNPVDLAEHFATLDIISGGRLVVGAGLGYRDVEFDAFGVPNDKRLRRFLDNLEVVRRLWTDEEVSFENDAIRLDGVRPAMRPVQRPHPPIWLAGHTPGAIRRAARLGYPYLIAAGHVEKNYLAEQARIYRDACAEFERPEATIHVLQEAYVGTDDDSAVEDVREALTRKFEAYRAWGQDSILPEEQSFDREFDELRQGRFILGGPDSAARQLAELIQTLRPGHIGIRPQWPGMPQDKVMASLRRFADEVVPAALAMVGRSA